MLMLVPSTPCLHHAPACYWEESCGPSGPAAQLELCHLGMIRDDQGWYGRGSIDRILPSICQSWVYNAIYPLVKNTLWLWLTSPWEMMAHRNSNGLPISDFPWRTVSHNQMVYFFSQSHGISLSTTKPIHRWIFCTKFLVIIKIHQNPMDFPWRTVSHNQT